MGVAAGSANGSGRRRNAARLGAFVAWLTRAQVSSAARERRDVMVLLLAVAFVAVPQCEHLPLWATGVISLLWCWRTWITLRNLPLPGHIAMLPMLALAAGAVWLQYRTLLGREAGVTFLLLLLALKLLEMRATRDVFVVVFLCFFILLTQFLHSQALPVALMTLGAVLALFFVLVSVSLKADDLPAGRKLRLVGAIALKAVPLTVVLFLLFPRLENPLWGLPRDAFASGTGLSNSMSPGGISRLLQSEAIAFRVRFAGTPPENQRLYWRGPVFGNFDGRTWSPQTQRLATPPPLRIDADPASAIDYTVTIEPSQRDWLFALEMPASLPEDTDLRPRASTEGQLLAGRLITARTRYEARSFTRFSFGLNETELTLRSWLALPAGYNPRTLQFAADLRARLQAEATGSATDRAGDELRAVEAALEHFRNGGFRYTLEPPLLGRDSVDEFLFRTRLGYCEHYASAFVVLMRALDIPARVVTGYQGGETNPVDGFMTVRQSDAHAWAEVWLAGRGWTRVDPTSVVAPVRIEQGLRELARQTGAGPLFTIRANTDADWARLIQRLRFNWEALENSWNQWVLTYSAQQQMNLLDHFGFTPDWRVLGILLALAVSIVATVLAIVSLRHRVRRDPLAELETRFRTRLERAGVQCQATDGLRVLRGRLAGELTPASQTEAEAILCALERWRYSPASANVPPAAIRQLGARVRRFRVRFAE
jgi:transglutaminase-like putative cysteine protease